MRRIWGAGQRGLRMGPPKPWEEVWNSSQYKAKPLTVFKQEKSVLRVVILSIWREQDEQWGSWWVGWEVMGAQTTLKAEEVEGSG